MLPNNWRYLRGDIYYADMEPHSGSEQGGKRPVVVLQNNIGNRHSPTLIVATVTTRTEKKKNQPTHVLVDSNPAFEEPSMFRIVLSLKSWISIALTTETKSPLPSMSVRLVSSTYWYVPLQYGYRLPVFCVWMPAFSSHCSCGGPRKAEVRFRLRVSVPQLCFCS